MNDFRAASLQGWSSVAPDWGELIGNVDRQLRPAAEWMLDAVALKPGDRVLEIAGGPGTVSLLAAEAVGEEGKVICSDFAEAMVAVARERIGAQGVQNVECRVMDAEKIDLPDEAVDVVLCRMGYMFLADPGAALRESARVLRPGGRLALAVWSEARTNPWAALPMRAIMQHFDAPPPPPDAPGLWALGDQDRLRGLLADAGLGSVRTDVLDDRIEYPSVEAWLELTGRLAGPVRALIASVDADGRAAITEGLATEAEPYRQGDGTLVVPDQMLVASAQRT